MLKRPLARPSLQMPRPLRRAELEDKDRLSREQASLQHNASFVPRLSVNDSQQQQEQQQQQQRCLFSRNKLDRRDTVRPPPLTVVSGKTHSRTLSRVPEKKDFKIS